MKQETLNITQHGGFTSSYRLRDEPVRLSAEAWRWFVPDGDGWAPAEAEVIEDAAERYRTAMRLRGSRKQRAAHAMIPTSLITVVKVDTVAPREVAIAIYEGRSEEEVKIAHLEAQIRELMGLARRPRPVPFPGKPVPDVQKLLAAMSKRRTR